MLDATSERPTGMGSTDNAIERRLSMRAQASRVICLVGVVGALIGASSAFATPGSLTFQESHPVAAALCERVASGHAGKKLMSNKAGVEAACSQLMSSYGEAQATVSAADTSYEQARQNAITAREEGCKVRPSVACRTARRNFRATMVGLHATYRAAVAQFHASVQSGRATFWSAIATYRQ